MFVRALAAVLVLCAALVGPASAATPPAAPPPIDPRLLIIGDSVILGAQPWVAAVLGARGWRVNLTSRESMHTWANAAIAAEATRWPNLRIIDWDARATPDPSLVYADGYHLNPVGQLAMTQLIADTLDSFVLETTAATTTTTTLSTTSSSVSTSSTWVTHPRASSGLDLVTVLAAAAGGLVVIGLVAMFATRVRRKPGSMA